MQSFYLVFLSNTKTVAFYVASMAFYVVHYKFLFCSVYNIWSVDYMQLAMTC